MRNFGIAAIIASILIPIAQILAPVVSSTYNTHLQIGANKDVEASKRRVEVTRILFENYFGKTAEQQAATIDFLTAMFPEDLVRARSILLARAATVGIRNKVTENMAVVANITPASVETAVENERLGFLFLLGGDLTEARNRFKTAYDAFPIYHNVDEIYNRVLRADLIQDYNNSASGKKNAILKAILESILDNYTWGIPLEIKKEMQSKLAALNE